MKMKLKGKNIFADKASLVLRKILCQPNKKWVVRNFIEPLDVSLGMAQSVLEKMVRLGYVERTKKGPYSYTILTNQEKLIEDWLKGYQFELNEIDTYYSPDKNILREIKTYLTEEQYALTLHTGANLITSFVKTEDIYFYLNTQTWDKDIIEIRQKLYLKELVTGGNVHIIRPYYKNSVFFNRQKIKGYCVVSNLQLYLDLYNFQPRGREHAENLKTALEEKEKHLD
ncbi:MAG: type IV toxin-antitoxin system AbiEi family antitoxin [Elusimicrobiota bacterium]